MTAAYDEELVKWFRAMGHGYQARMNAVLKAYMLAMKSREITSREGHRLEGGRDLRRGHVAIDYSVADRLQRRGMKPVRYSKEAIRTLRRMPRPTAERIRDKVAAYAADPASQAANVKALRARRGCCGCGVGDWRVIFEDGAVIAVIRIGPRGGVYD